MELDRIVIRLDRKCQPPADVVTSGLVEFVVEVPVSRFVGNQSLQE